MHESRRAPLSQWSGRMLSCAVALLGLGWMSCGSDPEEPPPQKEDLVAPGRIEITGGVSAGEFISGQRKLEAIAEDDSGRVVKVLFYVSGEVVCADSEPRDSGATFSCTWDASGLAVGPYQLTAVALDAAGNTSTSAPLAFSVGVANRPPVASAITSPTSVVSGDSINMTIGATDPDGDALTYSWRTNPMGLGVFTNGNTSAASWRSAEVTANSTRTVQVQVVVSDGVASVTRSVNVQVTVPTYAAHIQPIWNQACTSCHDSTSPSGGMNLLQGSSYAALVNVNGNNATCNTLKRVVAGQPDNSLLVRKISGATCGNRMPRNNATFFDTNPGFVTRIRSWIIAGALNN